jgi:tetratricopeptide (TPR) repeat protein
MGGLAFLLDRTAPDDGARPVASAQAMTEAWVLAQQAQSLNDRHEPEAALVAWQRAYELSSDPTLLLEIGRLERDEGNFARATYAFERLLENGEDRVTAQRLQLATRQLQAAAARTARINVQTNVVGAAVEIEPARGVATGAGFVVKLLLDAGERRLSFGKPGYETRSLVVTLEPGEVRTLRVDLDKAVGGRSERGSTQPRWTRLERDVAATGGVTL